MQQLLSGGDFISLRQGASGSIIARSDYIDGRQPTSLCSLRTQFNFNLCVSLW